MASSDQKGRELFSAGFKTLNHKELRLAVWYPTDESERVLHRGPFAMLVAPEARFKLGLVVISHGTGGSFLSHRGTAALLARHGFIVVALEHRGNNWRDNSKVGTQAFRRDRPGEISEGLSFILNESEYEDHINRNKIVGLGHSAGGYALLSAVAGGSDLSQLHEHCQKNISRDRVFCAPPKKAITNQLVNINFPREPRLRCLVLMAPVGAVFGEKNLDGLSIPIMLLRMREDRILKHPFHAQKIHDLLGGAVTYDVLEGGNHFSFIEPFPTVLKNEVGAPARDPDGFSRKVFLDGLNEKILNFSEDCTR